MKVSHCHAALRYADLGYRVFPLIDDDKAPRIKGWPVEATTDAETIETWWSSWPNANIGLVTVGFFVVDVDGSDNPWLSEDPRRQLELASAPISRTAGGGWHYLFRPPHGVEVRNSTGQIAPNVDVRGTGGYIVVPPSAVNSNTYAWAAGELDQGPEELPIAPQWLVDLAYRRAPKPILHGTTTGRSRPIQNGQRNSSLTSVGGFMRRKGLDSDEIEVVLQAINLKSCEPPLPESEVAGIARSLARYSPAEDLANSEKPVIIVGPDEHRVNDEIIAALALEDNLYARGRELCLVQTRTGDTLPRIVTLECAHLREMITRVVSLVSPTKEGDLKPAHPKPWMMDAVRHRGAWPGVRPLQAVVTTPTLRRDGTILETPGYDEGLQVYYDAAASYPPLPATLDLERARHACERLLDLVCDFRFEEHHHRSAWLAFVLTLVGRHAFDGPAPLFLLDANIRGSGKTLLATLAAQIAYGCTWPPTSYPRESQELRKLITGTARDGTPFVFFDNLAGVIGDDTLDRALTTTRWYDRLLGSNTNVDLPLLATWAATGNNVSVRADTGRRTVHIRLKSQEEHPEDRSGFKRPELAEYVRANHPRLFMDALTILAAYLRAGSPSMDLRPMGSYEGWTSLIRNAVVWVGLPDPCLGRDRLELVSDTELEAVRMLFEALHDADPDEHGFYASEMVQRLWPSDGSKPPDTSAKSLRDAFEGVLRCRSNEVTARKLGTALRPYRDRIVGGLRLEQIGTKGAKGCRWAVTAMKATP
jgi:hypothetical protein